MRPDAHDGLRVGAGFFGTFVLVNLGVLTGLPVLLILAVVFGWAVFCAEVPVPKATTVINNRYTAVPNGARRAARDSQ